MNVTIITSIIAAAAACLGALVPCLFSYLGKKKEYEIARLEQIENIRRTEYCNFMDILQQMVNEGNRDNFLSLQRSINIIMLFAGPKLSKIINEYFNILVTNAIAGKPTSLAENVNYQTLIVNAMRAELGVSAIELEQVQFVKAPIER